MKTAYPVAHQRFVGSGPARLLMYDTKHTAWREISWIDDFNFTPRSEVKTLSCWRKGKRTRLMSRVVDEGGEISFRIVEVNSPSAQHFLYGDSSTTQTVTTLQAVELKKWNFEGAYGTEEYVCPWEIGLGQAANLLAPTIEAQTSVSESGSLSAATYYTWVAQGYGTKPTTIPSAADCLLIDKTWIWGVPVAGAAVSVVAGGAIRLDVSPNTSLAVPLPDFWVVFVGSTSVLAAATTNFAHVVTNTTTRGQSAPNVVTTVTTQTFICTSHGDQSYEAPNYVFAEQTDTYGDTPTYTALTITTDFTMDLDNGTFARVSASTNLAAGNNVNVYIWPIIPSNFLTEGGARDTTEDYVKFAVLNLGPDEEDIDAEDRRQEGTVMTFYRVNKAGVVGGTSYTADDWHQGASITLEVLYSTTEGKIFDSETFSPLFLNSIVAWE
jgi:hypothetical protein